MSDAQVSKTLQQLSVCLPVKFRGIAPYPEIKFCEPVIYAVYKKTDRVQKKMQFPHIINFHFFIDYF